MPETIRPKYGPTSLVLNRTAVFPGRWEVMSILPHECAGGDPSDPSDPTRYHIHVLFSSVTHIDGRSTLADRICQYGSHFTAVLQSDASYYCADGIPPPIAKILDLPFYLPRMQAALLVKARSLILKSPIKKKLISTKEGGRNGGRDNQQIYSWRREEASSAVGTIHSSQFIFNSGRLGVLYYLPWPPAVWVFKILNCRVNCIWYLVS